MTLAADFDGGAVARLLEAVPGEVLDELNVMALDRVDSTNLLAKRLLVRHLDDDEEPAPFALVAREQTAGRGRLGRTWTSALDAGVYASVVLPVPSHERAAELPIVTGVALAEALNDLTGGKVALKWPNDLVIGGRKLGGVLVEGLTRGEKSWAIIGFGVNVDQLERDLPTPRATSLAAEGVAGATVRGTFGALLAALWPELAAGGPFEASLSRYRRLSSHRQGERLACELPSGRVEGDFRGFDDRGHLLLTTSAGPRALSAGEVIET